MSADTDFAALYRELGVRPECGLDEFRRAYRRRVAHIHPDRHAGADMLDLQRLNVLYDAAVRFEREHGRLPGAAAPRSAGPGERSSAAASAPDGRVRDAASPSRRASGLLYGLVALLAVLATLLWSRSREEQADPSVAPLPATVLPSPAGDIAHPMLTLGRSPDEVIDIAGQPVLIEGDRWLYGPSWVRFECLEVADWYSSPLRPLGAATARPAPLDKRMYRPARLENCGEQALP